MVLPGVADVMANAFLCVSILIKLLFPTLLLPISAYSGKFTSGHISARLLLVIKSAVLICIILSVML